MALDYIDSGQPDSGIYKGKIDESINLLRQPPVTAGTASAYTVADWAPLTLTDGLTYTLKAHTDNAAGCTVAGVNLVTLDGSAVLASQMKQNGVYHVLYLSSGPSLMLLNPSQTSKVLAIRSEPSGAPAGPATVNNWYRIASGQVGSNGRSAAEIVVANGGGTAVECIKFLWFRYLDSVNSSIQLIWNSAISTSGNIKAIRVVYNSTSQTAFVDIQANAAFGNNLSATILNNQMLGDLYKTSPVAFTDVTSLPSGDSVHCTLNLYANGEPVIQGFARSGVDDAYRVDRAGVVYSSGAEGSFTGTLTGFGTNPSGTIKYRKDGKTVSLWVQSAGIFGTSNSTSMTMTGTPSSLLPQNEQVSSYCSGIRNDGSGYEGLCRIDSSGITFFLFTVSGTKIQKSNSAFTASGAKGVDPPWKITYPLN